MEKFSGRVMSFILVVIVIITAYAAADGLLSDDETGIVISNSVLVIPAEESDGEANNEALIAAEPEVLDETEYGLASDAGEEIAPESELPIEANLAEEPVSDTVPEEVADVTVEAIDGDTASVANTMVLSEEKQPELHAEIDETVETVSVASNADLSDEILDNAIDAEIIENVGLEAEQMVDEMNAERQTADNELTVENNVSSTVMDMLYIEKETKVYERNDINSDVIAVFPEGCEVPLIEDMGEWLRVALSPEKEGYIYKTEERTEETLAKEITEETSVVFTETNMEEITEENLIEAELQEGPSVDANLFNENAEEIITPEVPSEETVEDEIAVVLENSDGTCADSIVEAILDKGENEFTPENPMISEGSPVREKADGLSDIFIYVTDVSSVRVLGIEDDWVEVEINGQVGYIYKDDTNIKTEEETFERKIVIFCSKSTAMSFGDTIYLTSKLEGYDDCEYIFYQWQYSNGNGWIDVPGGDQPEFSFILDETTNHTSWRLKVIAD